MDDYRALLNALGDNERPAPGDGGQLQRLRVAWFGDGEHRAHPGRQSVVATRAVSTRETHGEARLTAARPTSLLIAIVATLLFLIPGCDDGGDVPTVCTAEALVIDGKTYGRSREHGCRFVDEHGNVMDGTR